MSVSFPWYFKQKELSKRKKLYIENKVADIIQIFPRKVSMQANANYQKIKKEYLNCPRQKQKLGWAGRKRRRGGSAGRGPVLAGFCRRPARSGEGMGRRCQKGVPQSPPLLPAELRAQEELSPRRGRGRSGTGRESSKGGAD